MDHRNVRPRPLLVAVLTACAVWVLVHELRLLAFADLSLGPLSSRFAHDVMLLLVAGACLARAALVRTERTAWLLMGTGVLGWTFGEIYYTVVLWDESAPPIPSPADLGYLTFPVCTFAGMLALLRRRATFSPALVVDGIATALAVSALSAAIVFETALEHASGAPVAVATGLAYPVVDLLLLAVGVGALAGTGWRLDPTWALLAGGIVLFWLADSMYLVRAAEGTYESGGWFDAGWWIGLLLIAVAAWQPPPRRRVRAGPESLRLIAAPLASGAIALELLVYGSLGNLNVLAVGLAAAALVFVMVRLTLTFRQNVGMLRTSRDEALSDALTGLGNRRALTRALDEAVAEAVPESPVVLALFDLDGFKHYNDTFGHPAGDVLLARLGGNLKAFLGSRGQVFRMGGDEFCALFEPRLEDRVALLDGAALALSEQGQEFWIGCSYGAIAIPTEAANAADALRIADRRMYAQKHAGRMSAACQVKESLLTVLGARDAALVRHARAVADLAEATARALDLSHSERETVRLAAELHEAGRLVLHDAVGASAGQLAAAGSLVVASAPAIAHAAPLIGALHEPWEAIPLGARIVAVADAFDALGAHAEALAEIQSSARFDPDVLTAFAAVCDRSDAPFVVA